MTGPDRLELPRRDGRAHVRATDLLAEVLSRWPVGALTMGFARPLTGPAALHPSQVPGASVTGRAGGVAFSLVPLPDEPQRAPARKVPALWLAAGQLHAFAFRPGTSLADRIAAIFDRVHPRQAERFLVRRIELAPGPARRTPVLWFRLRIASDRRTASLVLWTPVGRLGRINFRLVPRAQAPGRGAARH